MSTKILCLTVALGGVLLPTCTGKPALYLVARTDVAVYASATDAMGKPPVKPESSLAPAQRAEVVDCLDVKHYLIYKVRLADGRVGFVNVGEYSLERNGKPSSCFE